MLSKSYRYSICKPTFGKLDKNTNSRWIFNKSRKLQKDQALKLHEDANVEINDYGNNLDDANKFANFMNIEINIIDSEQFKEIIYISNKGKEDKI